MSYSVIDGLVSSFHELIQSRGVCHLSVCVCVCKLFCANRYYYAKNGSIATKLAQDGQQARIQVVRKVKVKVKGHVIRALLCST